MLAAGVYDLGLTAAEFSSFTPRHIDTFYKRHLAAEVRRMMLTMWYANVHRDTDKKPEPFAIGDFVPGADNLTHIRVIETHPDETPEETMQRMIGPQPDPELVVARIKANARGFGKWSVENA